MNILTPKLNSKELYDLLERLKKLIKEDNYSKTHVAIRILPEVILKSEFQNDALK